MFGIFQRKQAPASPLPPRVARVQALLHRLVSQWHRTGYFMGGLGADLPRGLTPDGLEVASDPALLIGVTAAPRIFGIECAHLPAQDLVDSVDRVLASGMPPDWQPDLASDGGLVTTLALGPSNRLKVRCLPCPVDPCFNGSRHPGARMIAQVLRN